MVDLDLFLQRERLFTQPLDGANAARLDYELVLSSTRLSQLAAFATAWLILVSLGEH